MELKIYPDYRSLSEAAAEEILRLIKQKPDALLCLAAGDTPLLAYSIMVEKALSENLDLSTCSFVGLDEWMGIAPENEGSCQFVLRQHIFRPLGVREEQIRLFDALSADPEKECQDMDRFIGEKGGIELILVGIGRNGHIGFNEPGVAFDKFSHVIDLDKTTRSVGQKYFKETTVLTQGITLGLNHLMESRKAILMANGPNKAGVIRSTLEGEIRNDVPASIVRKHGHGMIMIDQAAAALLPASTE